MTPPVLRAVSAGARRLCFHFGWPNGSQAVACYDAGLRPGAWDALLRHPSAPGRAASAEAPGGVILVQDGRQCIVADGPTVSFVFGDGAAAVTASREEVARHLAALRFPL